MGVHPQAWQEQTQSWNWSADATEFTPGEPLNGEQFCGNGQAMAFFVPFPGSCGMGGMGSGMGGMGGMVNGVSMNTDEPNAELHEMEAKMAALQAENERLTQLYETECQLRQIEVTAYNQVFEMYAVPKAEAEEFARRLQDQVESLSPDGYQSNLVTGPSEMSVGNTEVTGLTGPVANGTNGNTTSVETLLKETFPHIKIHSLDEPDRKVEELMEPPEEKTEEELEQHLCQWQGMVGCTIDERAKQTLLSLPDEHGKAALSKVEDIIHEQGGVCRNLSSMVQSVCRKVGHTAMKQWKQHRRNVEVTWSNLRKSETCTVHHSSVSEGHPDPILPRFYLLPCLSKSMNQEIFAKRRPLCFSLKAHAYRQTARDFLMLWTYLLCITVCLSMLNVEFQTLFMLTRRLCSENMISAGSDFWLLITLASCVTCTWHRAALTWH